MKSTKTIHQVYGIFDDGVPLKDIPVFYENVQKTKQFCRDNGIYHKMWNLTQCNRLITSSYPEYSKLWKHLQRKKTTANPHWNPILAADFIRYCILHKYGGIYVDCDIHPIGNVKSFHNLFTLDYFFVHWNNDKKKLPYNAVMGSQSKQPIFKDIMNECKQSYYRLVNKPIYKQRKGRFIFHVTGHYMIQRVLKRPEYDTDSVKDILKVKSKEGKIICSGGSSCKKALFEDSNASVWFQGGTRRNKRTLRKSKRREPILKKYSSVTDKPNLDVSILLSQADVNLLYKITDTTIQLFNQHNLAYWATDGTLLGIMRSQGFIPWDDDVDLAIDSKDKELLKSLKPQFRDEGLELVGVGKYMKVRKPGNSNVWIDIFMLTNGKWPQNHFQDINFRSTQEIYPLKQGKFGSLKVSIPNKSSEYLDRIFPRWREVAYVYNHKTKHKQKIYFKDYPELKKPKLPTS